MSATTGKLLRVLLVDGNREFADKLQAGLTEAAPSALLFKAVANLQEALKELTVNQYECVLLELNLPDSQGLETLKKISATAFNHVILILADEIGEETALEAIVAGAQDCLLKNLTPPKAIVRCLRYSFARVRARHNPDQPAKEKPKAPAQAAASAGDSGEDYNNLKKAKILLVEDIVPMRRVMKKCLDSTGAIVDEAGNGQEALQALLIAAENKHPYNLVMTDLSMPVMGGVDLLRQIRGNSSLRETPVIVLSAQQDRESVVACAKYKVAKYIVKPFKTFQLLEAAQQAFAAGRSAG